MVYDIVHVTNVHKWDDNRICQKMAVSLAKHGLNVGLVAMSSEVTELTINSVNGVTVHLLPMSRNVNRLKRATIDAWRVYRIALSLNAKIYQAHDPELIPFCILLRLKGYKFVFDAHEDFVLQTKSKTWANGWKSVPVNIIAKSIRFMANKGANHIVAATEGVADNHPLAKTTVVNNYPILSSSAQLKTRAIPLSTRPARGIYVGTISEVRGLKEVILALDYAEHVDGLDLVGVFDCAKFEKVLRSLPGWKKVTYHGYKSPNSFNNLFENVKFGVVTLWPIPNYLTANPTKIFEYFAAGIPAVYSNFPYLCGMFDQHDIGIPVDPLNAEEIANAMNSLVKFDVDDSRSIRSKDLVNSNYSWDIEAEKYVDLIKQLSGKLN